MTGFEKGGTMYNKIVFPDDIKIKTVTNKISNIDSIDEHSEIFHEEIEIKFFCEGLATLMIGNSNITASAGDTVVINPYEFHSTIDVGEERGKYHLLIIGLDYFDYINNSFLDLRRIFTNENVRITNLIRDDKKIAGIISDIVYEAQNRKEMYKEVIYGLMTELFCRLLREYRQKDNKTPIPEAKKIKNYEMIYPAIFKIRRDYREDISIESLAELCNISKYYFCRVFKDTTGLSALQYQTLYRINIANMLFKNTNKSISEISYLCGFSDESYFSRCYKKHTGMSPKQKRAILSK